MLSRLKARITARSRKRRVLRSYAAELALALRKEHGRHRKYSARQVGETMAAYGFDPTYSPYAIAMYTSPSESRRFGVDDEVRRALRAEVADLVFEGNEAFSALDALKLSSGSGPSGFGGSGPGFLGADTVGSGSGGWSGGADLDGADDD